MYLDTSGCTEMLGILYCFDLFGASVMDDSSTTFVSGDDGNGGGSAANNGISGTK